MKKIVYRMFVSVLAISMLVTASASALAAESDATVEPRTDGFYTWKVERKLYQGYSYGAWKNLDSFVVSKKNAPMDVSFIVSTTYRNTVTGQVKVSYKSLEATMGYDLDDSTTVTLQATKKDAPAGTYYLKARSVFKCWKVKQQRYFHIDGTTTKSGDPVYCYAKKFDHSQKKIA